MGEPATKDRNALRSPPIDNGADAVPDDWLGSFSLIADAAAAAVWGDGGAAVGDDFGLRLDDLT